jgi:hypothetical protein
VYRIPKGDPGAGALVVHRIRALLPNGKYLFQGDNKPSPDDEEPTRADIVAAPVLDLGQLPTQLLMIGPIVCTVIVGIAVTAALWPLRTDEAAEDDVDEDVDADAVGRDGGSGDPSPADRTRFTVVVADRPEPEPVGAGAGTAGTRLRGAG